MSTGKVVLGVLFGTAIGAIAGILLAPEKGTVTRKKIYQKGDDYVSGVSDKFNSIMHSIGQRFEELKSENIRMADAGLEKAENIVTNTAAVAHSKMNQHKETADISTKN
jgi:gas vesicle protein